MTRVLLVEGGGNLWGSERALLDLLPYLGSIEIAVCCSPKTPLHRELVRRGVRVLPWFVPVLHRQPRWRRLQATFGVIFACLAFRPDVLHLNQCGIFRVTAPAARLFRLPVTAHVRIFEEIGYLARLSKATLKRLVGLICISKAVHAAVDKATGPRHLALHQVYDGYVGSTIRAPDAGEHSQAIVCAGRIEDAKGQALLIRALALLDRPQLVCHFAGDGPDALVASLKEQARQAGVLGAQWPGFVDDMPKLLRQCAILAFPSDLETLGRVILEAWDAGVVPVVYAGSGGAAEIVTEAQGGLVYDAQTPEALAQALREALALHEDERRRLIANGRAWMAINCDAATCGAKTAAILTAASEKGQ